MGNIQGGKIQKNQKKQKKIKKYKKKIGGTIQISTQEDLILIKSEIKSSNSRLIEIIKDFERLISKGYIIEIENDFIYNIQTNINIIINIKKDEHIFQKTYPPDSLSVTMHTLFPQMTSLKESKIPHFQAKNRNRFTSNDSNDSNGSNGSNGLNGNFF